MLKSPSIGHTPDHDASQATVSEPMDLLCPHNSPHAYTANLLPSNTHTAAANHNQSRSRDPD